MSVGAGSRKGVIDGIALTELTERPAGREEIILSCPGSKRVASFVNRRFVRVQCRQKRCRRDDGAKVYHIFDSITGRLVDNELEYPDGRLVRASDPGGV